MKLQDRLNFENRDLSYADFHPLVIKNVGNTQPSSSGLVSKKANEKEEIVKYMLNLPNYLERGGNIQEKALNVGVLDWRRLQKWEYNHKQIPNRNSRCSPSSSNSSTFFSTEGSSSHSSRGPSCSPARQQHQSTLQSHLNASPSDGCSEDVKSVVENVERRQDLKTASSNHLKGSQSRLRTGQCFSKTPGDNRLKECRSNDSDQQSIPKTKPSHNFGNYAVPSSSKGNMKIQDGEFKGLEKLQVPCYNISNHECPERHQTVVLLLPRDGSENWHSAISHPSDSKGKNGRRSMEKSRRSFSEGTILKEVSHAELNSDVPCSCPIPSEVDSITHSQIEPTGSIDERNKFSSEPFQPSVGSAKTSFSPSRVENLKEKSSTVVPTNSTAIKSSDRSDLKKGTAVAVRNISPTRRFIMGIGSRISKSSSSKESSDLPQPSSKHVAAKTGSVSLVNSTTDKTNATSRSQSSPLRRLIDPFLNPKAANSHQFAGPSHKDSASTDGACKSSGGQGRLSTVQSVKTKLDLKNCRTIETDGPHSQKHGSPTVQALLKVAVKNGLPLFTFAVENNSEILAATMKKLSSSRKDDNSWIYTFFTIRETKKKNGIWLNQGGKGKGHGYIPNVVAQMKVSDHPFSDLKNLIREKSVDLFSFREFVLFSVDLGQTDVQTTDLQLNDELAAIIVKFPRKTTRDLINSGQQRGICNNQPVTALKESLQNFSDYPNSNADEEKAFSLESEDLFSTTVILPSGDHGQPSKGEPSPLIERWKSGGLCDCGGWDLGCRIRVLANQTRVNTRSSSTKAHPTAEQFELFSLEEVPDNRPVFSLSAFEDGIFSVEFNSSVSLLQAFSICVAVLNSREPSELSELSNLLVEENPSEETTSSENDGIKGIQVAVSAKYHSY